MSMKMFVNLPVRDVARSIAFYEALGFRVNPQFTNAHAACLVLSEDHYVMVLDPETYQGFTPKAIADTRATSAALIAITRESPDAVRALCETAFAHGGTRYKEPQDHGFMYAWGFEDPDGHTWEPFWMNPAHVQG